MPDRNRTGGAFASLVLLFVIHAAVASCTRHETKNPDDDLIVSIAGRSESVFEKIRSDDIWPYLNPSLITHKLLACGKKCKDTRGKVLYSEWLNEHLWERQIKYLHRGELLYTLAELAIPIDTSVNLKPFRSISVSQILEREAMKFSMPAEEFHNAREARKGVEYGFLLRAFCHFRGPDGRINDQHSLPDVVRSVIKTGINPGTEAGTHELEGIASCYEKHQESRTRSPVEDHVEESYAIAGRFLERYVDSTLDGMREDGQLYYQDDSFFTCGDSDELCKLMVDLIKQTHFFEWAMRYRKNILEDDRSGISLRRMDILLKRIAARLQTDWYLNNGIRQGLTISAITHSIHVSKLLTSTLDES